jgi:ABC-type multidrug transport system fused ATPase/permease subunit
LFIFIFIYFYFIFYSSDINQVRKAYGETLGMIVRSLSTMVAALVISFTSSWILSLMLFVLFPIPGGYTILR